MSSTKRKQRYKKGGAHDKTKKESLLYAFFKKWKWPFAFCSWLLTKKLNKV